MGGSHSSFREVGHSARSDSGPRRSWRPCSGRRSTCSPGSGLRCGDPHRTAPPVPRRPRHGRAVPALPGDRPPGDVHAGGVHAAGHAALDARRLPVALSDARPVVAARSETRPGSRRRLVLMAAGAAGDRLGLLQTHWGLFQKGARGRLGLVRVSRDPTLDLYGWDQVAVELKQRGLLERPGTFLFTTAWYHSGQLAFAIRGSSTPVLCYNSWDARSFAFWSRSPTGSARTASSSRSTTAGRAALLRPLVLADRADRLLRGGPGRRSGAAGPSLSLRRAALPVPVRRPRRRHSGSARAPGPGPQSRSPAARITMRRAQATSAGEPARRVGFSRLGGGSGSLPAPESVEYEMLVALVASTLAARRFR